MDAPATPLHPMRLVTQLTGLSADTIRAWERRHGAVQPARTEGNTRRYTSREVRRLLLLREATRRGHAIGSIANLGTRALERLVAEDEPGLDLLVGRAADVTRTTEELAESYVGALCRYDGRAALQLLLKAVRRMDRLRVVTELLAPIAREVERRWSSDGVGRSHRNLFVHHLHVVAGTLDGLLGISTPDKLRVIVSAEETGPSEMTSLLAGIVVSRAGLEPVVAGVSLTRGDVEWALELSQATALVLVTDQEVLNRSMLGLSVVVVLASDPDWIALDCWAGGLVGG